jgi:LuxR family transcriptional regulator, maltose regulon positive regulatory protein
VVAPAGFGKTTLLAHLAERDERSFATVALDERDNDPVVLLRYVAAALDRVEPVPASVFEALSTPGRSLWSTCIPRVCAALSAMSSPIALVLDDLHFLRDPTCIDAVAALIDHVPERSRIMISSREDPRLPLARLRSQGRVLEIAAGELRLSATSRPSSSSPSGPRAGPRAYIWPRCRCRRVASGKKRSRRSAAMTGSWPTTCGPSSCRGCPPTRYGS